MTVDKAPPTKLIAWCQLIRLPNVFTVLADVGAAFLLVAAGPEPIARLICVLLAGVSLYWAGMVLNDVFDIDRDRQERPGRPLPAGHISIGQAKVAGWGLLLLGVGLAAASGYLPGDDAPPTWIPAAVGLVLAVMIVAYDGPLKKTPLAPFAMGGCRVFSFLLGASPLMATDSDGPLFPKYVIAIALGFGLYIAGVTTMARDEANEESESGPSPNLSRGLLLTMIGVAILAFAPRTAQGNFAWHIPPDRMFPMLIGMIAFPVLLRGLRLVSRRTTQQIQMLIRIGILTMIPLAAAFAFLGAGPIWGLAVFALAIPSILLAGRFRVT